MPVLDREEYIEQAYFFHAFRERILDGLPAQEVLARVGEEILSTTKLPLAISFLATEIKGIGLMAPAMARLGHYFTAVPGPRHRPGRGGHQPVLDGPGPARPRARGEVQGRRPDPAGLFVYQFEAVSRNRLGYAQGARRHRRRPVLRRGLARLHPRARTPGSATSTSPT